MKNHYILSLILYILIPSTIYSDPRKDVIVFDMDDVFVSLSKWSVWSYAAFVSVPHLPFFYWKKATDGDFKEKLDLIFSKKETPDRAKNHISPDCKFGSVTFRLVDLARIYEPFQKTFDPLLIAIHSKRYLLDDVITLLKKLKDKGYTLVVATNCDRIGFELKLKSLSFDTLYNGKRLFDAVIVGGIDDFVTLTTLDNGKRFSQLKPDKNFDGYITIARAYKPEKAYYQALRVVVDQYVATHQAIFDTQHPTIVFFDDKSSNVAGANGSNLNIKAYQVSKINQAASIQSGLENYFGLSFP